MGRTCLVRWVNECLVRRSIFTTPLIFGISCKNQGEYLDFFHVGWAGISWIWTDGWYGFYDYFNKYVAGDGNTANSHQSGRFSNWQGLPCLDTYLFKLCRKLNCSLPLGFFVYLSKKMYFLHPSPPLFYHSATLFIFAVLFSVCAWPWSDDILVMAGGWS